VVALVTHNLSSESGESKQIGDFLMPKLEIMIMMRSCAVQTKDNANLITERLTPRVYAYYRVMVDLIGR